MEPASVKIGVEESKRLVESGLELLIELSPEWPTEPSPVTQMVKVPLSKRRFQKKVVSKPARQPSPPSSLLKRCRVEVSSRELRRSTRVHRSLTH